MSEQLAALGRTVGREGVVRGLLDELLELCKDEEVQVRAGLLAWEQKRGVRVGGMKVGWKTTRGAGIGRRGGRAGRKVTMGKELAAFHP